MFVRVVVGCFVCMFCFLGSITVVGEGYVRINNQISSLPGTTLFDFGYVEL
jgi:hypothetical protein